MNCVSNLVWAGHRRAAAVVVLYVSQRRHQYLDNLEEREEAGTPDILGCIRTGAVYHLHAMIGIERIAAEELKMAEHLTKRLRAHTKVHILGPKERSHCAGIISFNILYNTTDGPTQHGLYLHYNFVAALLNDLFGIQARGGCACAGPHAEAILGLIHGSAERFEEAVESSRSEVFKPGFVRVGVHFTMTPEEVAFVADAILWIADNGWKLLPSYTFKTASGEWHHIKRDDRRRLKSLSDALDLAAFSMTFDVASAVGSCSTRCSSVGYSRRSSTSSIGSYKHPPDEDLNAALLKADQLCHHAVYEACVAQLDLPPLDPELTDLLWFAHPIDAKWSIMQSMSSTQSPMPMICTDLNFSGISEDSSRKQRSRPCDSIFNVRCWSDGVEPPRAAEKGASNRQSVGQKIMKMARFPVSCGKGAALHHDQNLTIAAK